MTLRHLQIYVKVYEYQNISKAAEALHLTQPAVSRALKELESYYGVPLFDRIGKRLFITESGRMYYGYALHILDSFSQMEDTMRNWNEVGTIRVGASITIGNRLLSQNLLKFKERHPSVQVYCTIMNGASLQKKLLKNEIDFAVIEGGAIDEQLCSSIIRKDRLVLILPPEGVWADKKEFTMEELKNLPLLLREPGSTSRDLVDSVFETCDIPVVPLMESVSNHAIIEAVHSGLGGSFLPYDIVRDALEMGYVRTASVKEESFYRDNYLVWHRNKYLNKSVREFMQLFHKTILQN